MSLIKLELQQVSVIIPAFNDEKTVESTIEGALAARCRVRKEIIVVDDGSTDHTPLIVQQYPQVVYLRQDNSGPASARNHGAQKAKGEVLFFTDADCTPYEDWIERILPHFSRTDVAAVSGSYGILNPQSLLAVCVHDEILYRHHKLMPDFPMVFGSYNVAIRKDVFDRIGGFNASYRYPSGEDNALSYKILKQGYRIFFERLALVGHQHPENLWTYLAQQSRHGFWRAKMYLDFPRMCKGDGYTFWKDPVEILWILVILLGAFLAMMKIISWPPVVLLILGLAAFEMFWSFQMARGFYKRPFLAWVMFLRSLARALGFIRGGFYFIVPSKNHRRKPVDE